MPSIPDPELGTLADTVATLVDQVAEDMASAVSTRLNWLGAELTPTAINLSFADTPTFATGAVLGLGTGELVYVRSVNAASKTAVVRRGVRGTLAQSWPADTPVDVGARFMRPTIRRHLRAEIAGWPSSVFAVGRIEVAMGAGAKAVDLPIGAYYSTLRIAASPGGYNSWPELDGDIVDGSPTSAFPNGKALVLARPLGTARTVQVNYARPFDTTVFEDDTELEADVLLERSHFDVAVLGALWRLLGPREVGRTAMEAQGEPRLAEEVPAGHIVQAAREFKRLRDARLREEALRLRERWTYRSVGV